MPASTPLFGVALEVSAQPARPNSGARLQRSTQPSSGAREGCSVHLVSPRSQFHSQQNSSIPVNYGPAPFKRRYRKCSGVLTCTAPQHCRARPLPINANGFWDYSNRGVKLTVNNVRVTDPQKVLKGNTAFAVNGGGGDSAPAGNITFSNITVNYTNGYSLPYFFYCGPSNSGGMAVISITNVSGSGKSRTDGMGLLNSVPVNTVAVN